MEDIFFIFVPCIFIMLIFFYQQMHFYLTYKILNITIYIKTRFYSYSYTFWSVQTKTCRSDYKKVFSCKF